MRKHALAMMAGMLGVCLNCFAQGNAGAAAEARPFLTLPPHDLVAQLPLPAADYLAALDNVYLAAPWLASARGGHLNFLSAFDNMDGVLPDELPAAPVNARANRTTTIATTDGIDEEAAGKMAEKHSLFDYVHGEIGALYGTSLGGGKGGGEVKQGYILGTVGNEKYQITAGAFYQESNVRFRPRSR